MVVADNDAIVRDPGRSDEHSTDIDESNQEETYELESDDDSHDSTQLDTSEASRKVYHAPEMLPDEFELRARALLARGSQDDVLTAFSMLVFRVCCIVIYSPILLCC